MCMKWYRIVFLEGKTHFVPDVLKEGIVKNMESRGSPVNYDFPLGGGIKKIEEAGLSRGGSCHVDDSDMIFDLPGVSVRVETRDVGYFLSDIREEKERLETGIPYFKIHGRFHCLCLLPEHREILIAQMEKRLSEALAIAKVERERLEKGMADIGNKVGNDG